MSFMTISKIFNDSYTLIMEDDGSSRIQNVMAMFRCVTLVV